MTIVTKKKNYSCKQEKDYQKSSGETKYHSWNKGNDWHGYMNNGYEYNWPQYYNMLTWYNASNYTYGRFDVGGHPLIHIQRQDLNGNSAQFDNYRRNSYNYYGYSTYYQQQAECPTISRSDSFSNSDTEQVSEVENTDTVTPPSTVSPNNIAAMANNLNDSEVEDGSCTNELIDDTVVIVDSDNDTNSEPITVTKFLLLLENAKPIDNIYEFPYPDNISKPIRSNRSNPTKPIYDPHFLKQFEKVINYEADAEWKKKTLDKIVITDNMLKPSANDFSYINERHFHDHHSRNYNRYSFSHNRTHSYSYKPANNYENNRTWNHYNRRYSSGNNNRYETNWKIRYSNKKYYNKFGNNGYVEPLHPSSNRWIPKSRLNSNDVYSLNGDTQTIERGNIKKKTRSLLNKLTEEKFEPICDAILTLIRTSSYNEISPSKLVIDEVILRACDEPHWSSMYAQVCQFIIDESKNQDKSQAEVQERDFSMIQDYIQKQCTSLFSQKWSNRLSTENIENNACGDEMMSKEYYEITKLKRRWLGLVQLICELYMMNILDDCIIFDCYKNLLDDLREGQESFYEIALESILIVIKTTATKFGNSGSQSVSLLNQLILIITELISKGRIIKRLEFQFAELILQMASKKSRDNKTSSRQKINPKHSAATPVNHNPLTNGQENLYDKLLGLQNNN